MYLQCVNDNILSYVWPCSYSGSVAKVCCLTCRDAVQVEGPQVVCLPLSLGVALACHASPPFSKGQNNMQLNPAITKAEKFAFGKVLSLRG